MEEYERILKLFIAHAELGDAAPEMQYVLATRKRLAGLATSLGIKQDALEQKKEEKKNPYKIATNTEARAQQEKIGKGPVLQLLEKFARRYLECVALADLCQHAIRERMEKRATAVLFEDEGEAKETPRQRAIRALAKNAGNNETKPPSTDPGKEPRRVGDRSEPVPVPVPQEDTGVLPDKTIDFQEVVPPEKTRPGA
jgi:hypothetical protein